MARTLGIAGWCTHAVSSRRRVTSKGSYDAFGCPGMVFTKRDVIRYSGIMKNSVERVI